MPQQKALAKVLSKQSQDRPACLDSESEEASSSEEEAELEEERDDEEQEEGGMDLEQLQAMNLEETAAAALEYDPNILSRRSQTDHRGVYRIVGHVEGVADMLVVKLHGEC